MQRSNTNNARRRRLKLGWERLEVRRVLDASAVPILDQMPDVAGQALTLDAGFTATANAQFGDFTYTTANGEVTITGYTGAGGAVEIPAQIDGMPVTAIGNSAFSGKASLTSVTIPNNVMAIGLAAFQSCTSIRSMTLPNSVTIMEGFLFAGCTNLISVDIPNSVSRIGYYAFGGCVSLTDVTIPDSVNGIGYGAFASCQSISSIVLPSGLPTLERYLFGGCTSLARVSISGNVTSIEPRVFSGCSALTSAYFVGSPPTLGDNVFTDCPAIIYRLPTATGWSSTYGGLPVEIFQPVDVAVGQTTTPIIDATSNRVLKQGAGTAILSTTSTRTSGTVVEAGELVVRNKDALGTGSLAVQAGAKAMLQIGYETVAVTSLNLANTSRLELGTGKLTVAANGFTESDIRTKLIAGRNGGSWDGPSGITSTVAGGDRSIGYRVTGGALEVAYAAPGDSNLDGVFDILDIGDILAAAKFNTGAAANWQQGDVNYDNVFDIVDLADILGTGLFNEGTYLTQASASSAAADTGTVATFDPALVFAALAMDSSSQPTTKRKSF
jgi:autotransporter-associated beta strand protein